MARSTFPVEVLTPEGEAFNDEVEMISTRTGIGSLGILANHAPLLAMLEPCELRLYTSGSENPGGADRTTFAQGEGYLQVIENSALIVVQDAIATDDLDRSAIESQLEEARDAAERAEEDSAERNRAQRDIKRYEAFLKVGDS